MTARQIAYQDFLKTPLWDWLRFECYRQAGHRCCKCGVKGLELHAHHRLYRATFKNTRQEDLDCVCFICHAKLHDREPVLDVPIALPERSQIKTLLDATIARKQGLLTREEFRRHKKAFQERNWTFPKRSKRRRR